MVGEEWGCKVTQGSSRGQIRCKKAATVRASLEWKQTAAITAGHRRREEGGGVLGALRLHTHTQTHTLSYHRLINRAICGAPSASTTFPKQTRCVAPPRTVQRAAGSTPAAEGERLIVGHSDPPPPRFPITATYWTLHQLSPHPSAPHLQVAFPHQLQAGVLHTCARCFTLKTEGRD